MKKGKSKSYNCINCGKCKSICPIGSDPKSTIHGKKVKCIHCGLCTYICPSYIHLKKYLDGDKNV